MLPLLWCDMHCKGRGERVVVVVCVVGAIMLCGNLTVDSNNHSSPRILVSGFLVLATVRIYIDPLRVWDTSKGVIGMHAPNVYLKFAIPSPIEWYLI